MYLILSFAKSNSIATQKKKSLKSRDDFWQKFKSS